MYAKVKMLFCGSYQLVSVSHYTTRCCHLLRAHVNKGVTEYRYTGRAQGSYAVVLLVSQSLVSLMIAKFIGPSESVLFFFFFFFAFLVVFKFVGILLSIILPVNYSR